MLYIVGLGLNEQGISLEGLEALKECKKVYLEEYTIEFPYSAEKLEEIIEKKIIKLDRDKVENNGIVKEAKDKDVALLVYGSPLFATTHISLIMEAEKQKVKTKIIYSASVFDAIAETGLQLYKFGKVSSLTKWGKNFEPDSFLDIIEQNKSINAHSIILVDIGLDFNNAMNQLTIASERRKINIDKIVVCSNLGTSKSEIFYGTIKELKNKKVNAPFCFIIPGEMHFLEEEGLERFE